MNEPNRSTSSKAQNEAETRLGWRMAGLAFTMSSEVAAGAILGWLVDWLAGTKPKGLIIGAIVGIADTAYASAVSSSGRRRSR